MKQKHLFNVDSLMAVSSFVQCKSYTHKVDTLNICINETTEKECHTLLILTTTGKSGSPYSSTLSSIRSIDYTN